MKDELGGKVVTEFASSRSETYSYLTEDSDGKNNISKRTKKCVIKRKLKFEDSKNYLEATHFDNKKIPRK